MLLWLFQRSRTSCWNSVVTWFFLSLTEVLSVCYKDSSASTCWVFFSVLFCWFFFLFSFIKSAMVIVAGSLYFNFGFTVSLTFEVHRKAMTAPVLSFFLAVVSCHAVLLCLFLFQRSVAHSFCHWWSWVFPPSIYGFKPYVCSIPVWTSSDLLQYLLLWSKLCCPLGLLLSS